MARVNQPYLGNVSNVFGPRQTGGAVGVIKTEGAKNEFAVNLTGEVLATGILSPVKIPKGSVITKAYLRVTELFVLEALSVVEVGTAGSEATNGVSLTEANLEAVGYVDVTAALAGTYDAEVPLAADSLLDVVFSAGSVTDRTKGKAVLVFETIRVIA